MAIKIYEQFAPFANPADGDHPYGSFKNDSIPGAEDGTPLDAVWANDYAGSDAELFAQAGVVPSGQPDKLGASQRVDAMRRLFDNYGTVTSIAAGSHPVGTYVAVRDRDHGVFLVQSGGTADGKGILDAGNGNTAALQVDANSTVKMFGAKGNGLTDDTLSMQAAAADGVQLYIDGVFLYSEPIMVKTGTEVSCSNAELKALTSRAQIRLENVKKVTVRRMKMNGNKAGFAYTSGDPFPIHIATGCKDIVIEDNEVFDAYRVGIYCGYGVTGVAPANIHILRNKIYSIGSSADPIPDFGNGIACSAGIGVFIRDNTVYDIAGTGGINCEGIGHPFENIHITGNSVTNITNTIVAPDSARGIRVDAGSSPIVDANKNIFIKDNVVADTAGSGIYVKDMMDYIISENMVSNTGIHGIECVGTDKGSIAVKDNTVTDYTADGISCVRGEFVDVSDNTIHSGKAGSRHGIRYTIQDSLLSLKIHDNTILSTVLSPIAVCSKSFSIQNNTLTNVCTGGAGYAIDATTQTSQLPANESGVISGNTLVDSPNCAAMINAEGENFGKNVNIGVNSTGGKPLVFYGADGKKAQLINGTYPFAPSSLNAPGSLATWGVGQTIRAADPLALGAIGWVNTVDGVGGVWSRYGQLF